MLASVAGGMTFYAKIDEVFRDFDLCVCVCKVFKERLQWNPLNFGIIGGTGEKDCWGRTFMGVTTLGIDVSDLLHCTSQPSSRAKLATR